MLRGGCSESVFVHSLHGQLMGGKVYSGLILIEQREYGCPGLQDGDLYYVWFGVCDWWCRVEVGGVNDCYSVRRVQSLYSLFVKCVA